MKAFFDQIKMGFCLWDVLALVLIVGIVIFFGVRIYRARARTKELENRLMQKAMNETLHRDKDKNP